LNKVQNIRAADTQSSEHWALNYVFAAYTWNGPPVDGTDIIRSFAAKARIFHFPFDVQNSNEVARIPQQGEAMIQHVETMFPLWFQQMELLKVLNDELRNRNRETANQNKSKRTFQPGDLVIVRKQVRSSAEEGKPAKLTLRSKGPYRVLEEAGDNSHFIQKLPALQSLTKRPGKRMKELLAMHVEKLPSSMVVHKRVAILAGQHNNVLEGELVSNPLETNLGF
jgi:hypothetical protein